MIFRDEIAIFGLELWVCFNMLGKKEQVASLKMIEDH